MPGTRDDYELPASFLIQTPALTSPLGQSEATPVSFQHFCFPHTAQLPQSLCLPGPMPLTQGGAFSSIGVSGLSGSSGKGGALSES